MKKKRECEKSEGLAWTDESVLRNDETEDEAMRSGRNEGLDRRAIKG